jgi:ribosome maturation protein Sdo1
MGKKTTINYYSDLSLRKTLFTYKKEYWKMFNSFFSLPEINQQVQNEAMGKLELLKKESSEDES